MSSFDEPPKLSYLRKSSDPDPDDVRQQRLDDELLEELEVLDELLEELDDVESSVRVDILEEVLKK